MSAPPTRAWVKMISNYQEIRVIQPNVDQTKHKTPSLTVVGIKHSKDNRESDMEN